MLCDAASEIVATFDWSPYSASSIIENAFPSTGDTNSSVVALVESLFIQVSRTSPPLRQPKPPSTLSQEQQLTQTHQHILSNPPTKTMAATALITNIPHMSKAKLSFVIWNVGGSPSGISPRHRQAAKLQN